MSAKKKKDSARIASQLKRISKRLDALEHKSRPRGNGDDDTYSEEAAQCCGLPVVPTRELEAGIDPGRESIIRSIEKKWVNGTELKYYFFDSGSWGGSSGQQDVVRAAFREWKDVGIGLAFREVKSARESDVRIGFDRSPGEGSWSYVGRDIWRQPTDARTMNFGWRLSGQNGRDTALHEIGHTLGFHHEQQNPFAGIEWDDEAVYRAFGGPPNNWPRAKTFHNVLRTLDPNSVEGSNWDADSIMQYSIEPGLILRPEDLRRDGVSPDPGLSDTDRARVSLFYPEIEDDLPELKRWRARQLKIGPGEQVNYAIRPTRTGRYDIRTFGLSDTLMVLFEDNDGNLEHYAADDDSGWNRNASLNVRLAADRKYVLRLRLYYSHVSGETAVMLW